MSNDLVICIVSIEGQHSVPKGQFFVKNSFKLFEHIFSSLFLTQENKISNKFRIKGTKLHSVRAKYKYIYIYIYICQLVTVF